MRTSIVLIDFENVQPEAIGALSHERFKVYVFVGAHQTKVSFDIAHAIQRMGSRAEYIKISGNGSNALDFHIAFYIGQLAASDPTAWFYIVSKDTGFDPLIQHLKTKNIHAFRAKDVSEIPQATVVTTRPVEERLSIITAKLQQPNFSKPRTVKTLSSTIATHFQKQLSVDEVAAVVEGLRATNFVTVVDGKVTYSLASSD